MKRFFLTTALSAALVGPALAGSAGTQAEMTTTDADAKGVAHAGVPMHTEFLTAPSEQSLHASDMIGARVYVAEDTQADEPVVDIVANWDDIGEVHDILITEDGGIEAALVDIGGFLGIGEKTVAVSMSSLDIVSHKDGMGWFVVFPGDREVLENAPAFDPDAGGDDAALAPVGDMGSDQSASVTADGGETQVDGVQTPTELKAEKQLEEWIENGVTDAPPPDVAMEPTAAEATDEPVVTAEGLKGAPVFDSEDNHVGEVSQLILDEDGRVESGIVDIGGVLGIGGRSIALDFETLSIERDAETNFLEVHVDMPRKDLERLPAYRG